MNFTLKILSSITILTALIIGVGLFSQNILSSSSHELENHISVLEDSTSVNDWKTAEQKLTQIEDKWESIKGTWAVLIDHQEIDNIDLTLSRMKKYIQSRDMSPSLAEASELKRIVNHIPKRGAPTLDNIF